MRRRWLASVDAGRQATAPPNWAIAGGSSGNGLPAYPLGLGADSGTASTALDPAAPGMATELPIDPSGPSSTAIPGADESYTTWSGSDLSGHVDIVHHAGLEERDALSSQIDAARSALDGADGSSPLFDAMAFAGDPLGGTTGPAIRGFGEGVLNGFPKTLASGFQTLWKSAIVQADQENGQSDAQALADANQRTAGWWDGTIVAPGASLAGIW